MFRFMVDIIGHIDNPVQEVKTIIETKLGLKLDEIFFVFAGCYDSNDGRMVDGIMLIVTAKALQDATRIQRAFATLDKVQCRVYPLQPLT